MTRTIFAIVIGLICGIVLIFGWESFIYKLFPSLRELNDMSNKEVAKVMMNEISVVAYVLMLLGYILAAFVSGAVATAIDKSKKVLPSLLVAGLFMLIVAAEVLVSPRPTWFIVSSLVIFPLFALISAALILRVKREDEKNTV